MLWGIGAALMMAWAGGWQAENEIIWDTQNQKFISLVEFQARAGEIIVLAEEHATKENATEPETFIHHFNQLRLIAQLQTEASVQGATVSVGMEFFTYNFQPQVDEYLAGTLAESDFLSTIQWGGNPFEFYRSQVLAPQASGGQTVALNIPRAIAAKVAKLGRDALDESERAWLPPKWNRGNDAYFERFSSTMKGHVPPSAIENYFWAQSLWDSTMTWRTLTHRARYPQDILIIIVGAFHVEYGGGLPYELRAQGAKVKTVVQIVAPDFDAKTLEKLSENHPVYGAKADFLWLHAGAVKNP